MASESPQVRRRPTRAKLPDPYRNSNLVRASVLETALELGFAQNSTVADWIFNNPLLEEAEDSHPEPDNQVNLDTKSDSTPYVTEAMTPTLTSGSNSTSDESSSLNSPANHALSAAVTTIQAHSHKPSVTESPHVHFGDFASDQLQLFSPFTLSPHVNHLSGTRDISHPKLPRDAGRSHSQDDSLEYPSTSLADSGYTSEGQYLSKGKKDKPKRSKLPKLKTPDSSKTSEKDTDYASDGGYLSASSNKSQGGKSPGKVKSRAMAFFRRRPKKSVHASDDEEEDTIPPVPPIPTLPRPSSPKPLERRAASPARAGFSPLTLNLTSPPGSPARRRVSKSPPPIVRATSPQQPDQSSVLQVVSTPVPAIFAPAASPATIPLPSSMPGTPLSTASFPATPSSIQITVGAPKTLTPVSSRQHLSIPPQGPPPTLPLPQPPSPSPTTQSRKGAPTRPIPVVPSPTRSTLPLTPRRAASPFRPLLPPRVFPPAVPHRTGDSPIISEGDLGDPRSGRDPIGKQRGGTASLGTTPAFLQRKIQHAPSSSPRHPPPDVPLPPSPRLTPSIRPRTPVGSSKFHEHFSSLSSTQVMSTSAPMSPSRSTAALTESSSGFSVRSSHISSASERSEGPICDPGNMLDYSRPTTSASILSCSSYGHPIPSTFGRPAVDLRHFSGGTDGSSSVYLPTMHRDSGNIATYDADDADVEDTVPRSYVSDDDDASVYTTDDKTAGRRTMYLMEHDESDENGDEIVIAGSHYWGGHELPPPVPPLPLMSRPGPGYF